MKPSGPSPKVDDDEVLARLRLRRDVTRLHRLGPEIVARLLEELGAERSIMVVIERKVARYADLDPELMRSLGADKPVRPPLHLIEGADR